MEFVFRPVHFNLLVEAHSAEIIPQLTHADVAKMSGKHKQTATSK
jgi:hypothetical protein